MQDSPSVISAAWIHYSNSLSARSCPGEAREAKYDGVGVSTQGREGSRNRVETVAGVVGKETGRR